VSSTIKILIKLPHPAISREHIIHTFKERAKSNIILIVLSLRKIFGREEIYGMLLKYQID
jgi:hypothetical protein